MRHVRTARETAFTATDAAMVRPPDEAPDATPETSWAAATPPSAAAGTTPPWSPPAPLFAALLAVAPGPGDHRRAAGHRARATRCGRCSTAVPGRWAARPVPAGHRGPPGPGRGAAPRRGASGLLARGGRCAARGRRSAVGLADRKQTRRSAGEIRARQKAAYTRRASINAGRLDVDTGTPGRGRVAARAHHRHRGTGGAHPRGPGRDHRRHRRREDPVPDGRRRPGRPRPADRDRPPNRRSWTPSWRPAPARAGCGCSTR